jgi:uncharacterized membrane protein
MGFWLFMLIMDLLIPAIMVGFGSYYAIRAPKEINNISGYRTTMSMKNKDTWEFAHHYCGKIWRAVGWGSLVLTIVAMIFVFGKDTDTVGILGTIVVGVQLIIVIGSIIPTEVALRKVFDKDGNRR